MTLLKCCARSDANKKNSDLPQISKSLSCKIFLKCFPSAESPGSYVRMTSNASFCNLSRNLFASVDLPDPSMPSIDSKIPCFNFFIGFPKVPVFCISFSVMHTCAKIKWLFEVLFACRKYFLLFIAFCFFKKV